MFNFVYRHVLVCSSVAVMKEADRKQWWRKRLISASDAQVMLHHGKNTDVQGGTEAEAMGKRCFVVC